MSNASSQPEIQAPEAQELTLCQETSFPTSTPKTRSICKITGHTETNKKFHETKPAEQEPKQKKGSKKSKSAPNPQQPASVAPFNPEFLHCPDNVIAGAEITKQKRQEMFGGSVSGGAESMGPEKYQRKMVEEGTGTPCTKTDMRINLRTSEMKEIIHPNKRVDGFNYSENFDGLQQFNQTKIYLDLKSIVGKGGAQTRSLREVYWFIDGQSNVLKSTTEDIRFANILDGDEAHNNMDKYEYLIGLPEFKMIDKNRIYIGDLKGYFDWVKNTISDESGVEICDKQVQMESSFAHTPSTL